MAPRLHPIDRCLRLISLTVLLVGVAAIAPGAEQYATVEEALARAYPEADSVERVEPELSAEQARAVLDTAQSRARGRLGATYLAQRGGRSLGVAFVDHVIGRTEFITWLCALDAEGAVRRMEILVYREPYGSEIRSRDWLTRFEDRDLDDPPRLRRGVPNIGGATLSCQAIVDRTRFLLAFHELVLADQIPDWLPAPEPGAVLLGQAEGPVESPVQRAAVIGRPVLQLVLDPGGDRAATIAAAERALATAEAADAVFNTWRRDSELGALETGPERTLSPRAAHALSLMRELHRLSDGRFDPTVRPLVELWAAAGETGSAPDPTALAAARSRIGFDRVTWDPNRSVLSLPENITLDSSAILKGLVVDAVVAELEAAGASGCVDFGTSSLAAVGREYRIALRAPDAPMDLLGSLVLPAGRSLAVSGSYHQRWTIDGESRSHLIDPSTGEALVQARAAAVIAPSAALADGLATACCLLGPDRALAVVADVPEVEAWIWHDGTVRTSPGWPGLEPLGQMTD